MTRLTSSELCTALATRTLDVHYQPIANWSGHGAWDVSGVEALLRCRRACGESVPPDRVLPIAERAGLIGQLTHYVLSHTLRSLLGWQAHGVHLHAAVNLHAESLMDPALVDKLVGLADAHQIDPRRRTLGNLDCDRVQGYLLGRAAPAIDVPASACAWNRSELSRTPRHFQQHTLPGIPSPGEWACDSGVYLASPAA